MCRMCGRRPEAIAIAWEPFKPWKPCWLRNPFAPGFIHPMRLLDVHGATAKGDTVDGQTPAPRKEARVATARWVGSYVGDSNAKPGFLNGGAISGFRNHPQFYGRPHVLVEPGWLNTNVLQALKGICAHCMYHHRL